MVKLDLKDRKILYQLNLDSKQSFRSIGRKVGLSKDTVVARVNELQKKEIITRFITRISYLNLGFIPLRFYFKYQNVTPTLKKEVIDHFIDYNYSMRVVSVEGNYDLIVIMLVKDIPDIYLFWRKTLNKYGDYFANRVYSNTIGESYYKKPFLLGDDNIDTDNNIKHKFKTPAKKVTYDDIDLKILKSIVSNSRTSFIDIAEKIGITASTVNNRIKRLKKVGIIIDFSIGIGWDKLDYQYYKVDIFLKKNDKIDSIIKYVEKNPYLACINHTLGYADLELEFVLRNLYQLNQIIDDISNKFPDSIRNYSYFCALKFHERQKFPIFLR